MKRTTMLQTHRLKAFTKTLDAIEMKLQNKIQFVTDFAEVYKLPRSITRRNLKQYKKWLSAAQHLKNIENKL